MKSSTSLASKPPWSQSHHGLKVTMASKPTWPQSHQRISKAKEGCGNLVCQIYAHQWNKCDGNLITVNAAIAYDLDKKKGHVIWETTLQ